MSLMQLKSTCRKLMMVLAALLVVNLLLPSGVALAQTVPDYLTNGQQPGDELVPSVKMEDGLKQYRPMDRSQVLTLVEQALPKWDRSLLEVSPGDEWSDNLDIRRVYEVMKDQPPLTDTLPPDFERLAVQRLGDDERIVYLDRNRGKLKYISRKRAWNFKRDASSRAVEPRQATEVVFEAISALGIPKQEVIEPRLGTQVAASAPVGSKEPEEKYEMYRILTFPRGFNRLPVYGSRVQSRVSNSGMIQSLKVTWPTFRLNPDLVLRSRRAVVDEIVQEITDQDPLSDTQIKAYLAYAPGRDSGQEVHYVPAVIVSVYSRPTPYQLVIPVAEKVYQPGGDDE